MDSKNPMIQYQISNIYMNQGKNDEALNLTKNTTEKAFDAYDPDAVWVEINELIKKVIL